MFVECKLGIEIDENGHTERCKTKERERRQVIENAGFKIITINPDKEDFDIFDGIRVKFKILFMSLVKN